MNSHCANSCFMPFSFSLVLSLGQLIGRSEQMLELIRSPKLVTGPGVAEHSGVVWPWEDRASLQKVILPGCNRVNGCGDDVN